MNRFSPKIGVGGVNGIIQNLWNSRIWQCSVPVTNAWIGYLIISVFGILLFDQYVRDVKQNINPAGFTLSSNSSSLHQLLCLSSHPPCSSSSWLQNQCQDNEDRVLIVGRCQENWKWSFKKAVLKWDWAFCSYLNIHVCLLFWRDIENTFLYSEINHKSSSKCI